MLPWYYDKKELRKTPSNLEGIKYETECQYRKDGARFIIETGNRMDLGYVTMATGVTYFHRFYMIHSFNTFPKYLTACACLFLAGKVEETPKKCKDIIKMAERFLSEEEFMSFGPDPRGEVIILERIILQTIRFDLTVDHPYEFLLRYAKCLKGDRAKMEKMLQMAWTFVNDSLCTTLCLQWEPEIIAIAMLYLAAKLSKYEIKDWAGKQRGHNHWWDIFVMGVTLELMEDICHQVLDLYSQKKAEQAQAQALAAANAEAKAKMEPTTATPKDHVKSKITVVKTEPTLSSKLLPPPALPTDLEALAVAQPPVVFEPQSVTQATIPVITSAGHTYFPAGSTPVPTMFPYVANPETAIISTYPSTPSNFQTAPPPTAGYQVGSSFGTTQAIVPPPVKAPPPPPNRYNANNSMQSPRYPHGSYSKSPHFNSPTRASYHSSRHSSNNNYRQAPYTRPRPPPEHHRSKHYYPRRW